MLHCSQICGHLGHNVRINCLIISLYNIHGCLLDAILRFWWSKILNSRSLRLFKIDNLGHLLIILLYLIIDAATYANYYYEAEASWRYDNYHQHLIFKNSLLLLIIIFVFFIRSFSIGLSLVCRTCFFFFLTTIRLYKPYFHTKEGCFKIAEFVLLKRYERLIRKLNTYFGRYGSLVVSEILILNFLFLSNSYQCPCICQTIHLNLDFVTYAMHILIKWQFIIANCEVAKVDVFASGWIDLARYDTENLPILITRNPLPVTAIWLAHARVVLHSSFWLIRTEWAKYKLIVT